MADEVSNVNGGPSTNDSMPVTDQNGQSGQTGQTVDVSSRSKGPVVTDGIRVTAGRNIRPRNNMPLIQPPVTAGWPPYGLPPGYTPPVSGFAPQIRFGSMSGVNNSQNPQQQSEFSRDLNLGSTSNASNSMAAFRQHGDESHHDLVNLLTQQMTTILNPMMADHETKFERLARQVERIARIVDYEKEGRHDARG